mmetsp:Transcript_21160/g.50044  ORF Transcript_21160/g.50044 Transcript_21160/m.50044 type:complete len:211 (-) Transcript_21160:35-667(-)
MPRARGEESAKLRAGADRAGHAGEQAARLRCCGQAPRRRREARDHTTGVEQPSDRIPGARRTPECCQCVPARTKAGRGRCVRALQPWDGARESGGVQGGGEGVQGGDRARARGGKVLQQHGRKSGGVQPHGDRGAQLQVGHQTQAQVHGRVLQPRKPPPRHREHRGGDRTPRAGSESGPDAPQGESKAQRRPGAAREEGRGVQRAGGRGD